MRLVRGRSTPAIRAIAYPCLCLCFAFVQITRTTPRRRTILHLSQIRLTDALTFTVVTPGSRRCPAKAFFLGLLYYPTPRDIAPGQFHDDAIPHEHPDEIPFEWTADMCGDPPGSTDFNVIQSARQLRPNDALHDVRCATVGLRRRIIHAFVRLASNLLADGQRL